jgi:triacylglycerol lipase
MKKIIVLFFLWVFSLPSAVSADTVLLLHGYLGSSVEWQRSSIVEQLDDVGWLNAGVLDIKKDRVIVSNEIQNLTRRLYSLELASEKSIDAQVRQLDHYIEYVRHWHTDEQIILIGHSAGGIVARSYMVNKPNTDLMSLVTIASPHLGAKNAELAQAVSEKLPVWVESIPGVEKIYRSQGLFFDLMPNRIDNLIGWLNYQPHPQARYYSIVREETDDVMQDFIVPSSSQDMNEVFALRGQSKTYTIKSLHGLTYKDGEIIKKILLDLYTI